MNRYLTACALVLLSATPAMAVDVTQSAIIAAAPEAVWQQIEPFCGLSDWHPAVEKCELRMVSGRQERVITLKGGAMIEERLLKSNKSKRSIEYGILSGPLPVKDYISTIKLVPVGKATKIVWSSKFSANGVSDAEALKIISGVYIAGFDGLKKTLNAK